MSPEQLARQLAELRESGEKLRARPRQEIVSILGRVLESWRSPDSSWRRELQSSLCQATGFHPATVREGLERGLARFDGAALRALVERELAATDGARALGFDVTSVVLAGSIPMPSLLSLLAPLLLASPVLAKIASRDPVTAPLFARSLREADPDLGSCVACVDAPRGDAACTEQLCRADCVVVTGSDAAVAALRSRVAPHVRFVGYGHRLSLGAVGPDALRGAALAEVAGRAALDVALWDQLGCLSPIAFFAVGGGPELAEALAAALAEAERRWPRGVVEPQAAALAAHERAGAELRAAAGRDVRIHGEDGRFTVVLEDSEQPRPAPLHRFVRVVPVADAAALIAALRPYASHLAALGVAGFGDRTAAVAEAAAQLGASRVCPLGDLQSPPLDWPRDGLGVLRPLARWSSLEP